jgi:ABC-type oligopeptide transport system ATPase subunit
MPPLEDVPVASAGESLVSLSGLRKEFPARRVSAFGARRKVVAVDDVGFEIRAGSTFGLVGESGSGKSTVAKMILKLERPDAGEVTFDGRGLWQQTPAQERDYRRNVQAVLQDPYGALSPRLKVRDIVGEPLSAQGKERTEIDATVSRLLDTVGLGKDAGNRYPHQFSGGQRQRIAIARALSVEPRLLVLDEPVSALDVSIRAQILMLLREMQDRLGLTYLFVGHDLAIVRYVSAVVGVMYFGRMVEIGPADDVLRHPQHPYTERLVSIASMRQALGTERTDRRAAQSTGPSLRLPLSDAMSVRDTALHRRGAAAARVTQRAPRGVPLPAYAVFVTFSSAVYDR